MGDYGRAVLSCSPLLPPRPTRPRPPAASSSPSPRTPSYLKAASTLTRRHHWRQGLAKGGLRSLQRTKLAGAGSDTAANPQAHRPGRHPEEKPTPAPRRQPRRYFWEGAGPRDGGWATAGRCQGLLLQAPRPTGGKGPSRDAQVLHVAHPGAARGPQGCPPSPCGPSVLM